jgi:hypothetical protein
MGTVLARCSALNWTARCAEHLLMRHQIVQIAKEDARAQLTVRMRTLLVPPLEQPRLSVLPAGVRTAMLKLPGAWIMEELIVTVARELLSTDVARIVASKTTSDEATNWVPDAVSTKLGGSCEKTIVAGEIELSDGAGRELPQRGFSALQPGKSESRTTNKLRRPTL